MARPDLPRIYAAFKMPLETLQINKGTQVFHFSEL